MMRPIRTVEKTHYPRSGEPNPKVRFGVVAGEGGPVQWADFTEYSPDPFLISEVGWWPDGSSVYCYVQNRIQSWLDLVKFAPGAEETSVKRLFRDSTKAWIESPGLIHWFDDDTFLWLWERDGWKHIYQYDASWHPQSPAHVRSLGGQGDRAYGSQERLDYLERHAGQPDGHEFLSHQARWSDRAADAGARAATQ